MKLTKRQLDVLKCYAGLVVLSDQSCYYGKPNLINRRLSEKGLIELAPPRDCSTPYIGWKLTAAGWAELIKRRRNFPAMEAWRLAELVT